jgi:gamma-glutamyltranspeptidase / glutathione hydrolase
MTEIQRATAMFRCEKQPATGSRGMVVTNHPLASLAGTQILLEGGNAVDAAVAALFALTVVEPMMVGVLGGGVAHIRHADGRHSVIDGLSTAPARARPGMFGPAEVAAGANTVGPLAMAVPGALAGWCAALERFGTVALADIVAPAIRLAERGFTVTPYLTDCIADTASHLARDPDLAALFLPGGQPVAPGTRLIRSDYAQSLRLIAREGVACLQGGALGAALVEHMAQVGGLVEADDLAGYRVAERAPIRGQYRGYEVFGPPPPSSGGVHIAQMLAILEGYDIGALGFGTPDGVHLLAEVLKIAFADRAVATADPDFVTIPVARLISPDYAAERRARLDMATAQAWGPGVTALESANTTHVTVADADGTVVATTQTINSLFGARFSVPGTGLIANDYMLNFDPVPGRALSIAPGKRVFTSMAPMMAVRDGRVAYALGLPGGLRIFGSALQALVNLIDHGMSPQQAVEAPRVWTQGGPLELEPGIPDDTAAELAARGHAVQRVRRIAGGMSAIAFHPDGMMTGAACWRADGTPIAVAGGLARAGVRFSL